MNINRVAPIEPLYPAEQLRSLAPVDLAHPMDMLAIIARIVDASVFDQFKRTLRRDHSLWIRPH